MDFKSAIEALIQRREVVQDRMARRDEQIHEHASQMATLNGFQQNDLSEIESLTAAIKVLQKGSKE